MDLRNLQVSNLDSLMTRWQRQFFLSDDDEEKKQLNEYIDKGKVQYEFLTGMVYVPMIGGTNE